MSIHLYNHFSTISSLRRFNFDLLYQFLLPYKDYLCSQHHFRWTDNLLQFPYQDLANILAEPDDEMPELLHNGIFFIDELSTSQAEDFIVQQLKDDDHAIPSWVNTANLALYSWLLNPGILQAVHPQLAALRPRRFEKSYSARSALPDLSKERIIALEDELNNWFDSLNKGRGVQVMHYQRNGIISFQLRHGELYKRDIALKNNGQTKRIVYRPKRYDFLDYTPDECQLKIHSDTKRENKVYRHLIGKYCFDDENFFLVGDRKNRYTLEPIRDIGREALICRDIDGLEWVHLKELHTKIPEQDHYYEVFKSSNHCLFDDWDTIGKRYRDTAEFVRATFLIQVAGLPRARSLTICLPDITIYERRLEVDRLFVAWMKKRLFTL
jgi:hypothetical protein